MKQKGVKLNPISGWFQHFNRLFFLGLETLTLLPYTHDSDYTQHIHRRLASAAHLRALTRTWRAERQQGRHGVRVDLRRGRLRDDKQ